MDGGREQIWKGAERSQQTNLLEAGPASPTAAQAGPDGHLSSTWRMLLSEQVNCTQPSSAPGLCADIA